MERLTTAVLRILWPHWVSLLLIFGLFSVTVASIDSADWMAQDAAVLNSLTGGLLVGWLLAYSRFHGRFVLAYALFMGLLSAIQAAGAIIPGPFTFLTTPFLTTLNDMNFRMFTFWLRFTGWMEAVRAGKSIEDTGLFVMLLAALLWCVFVWLMWFLIRKRQALTAVLPLAFIMALNVHLSQQSVAYYWSFLFCAILLVARTSYIRQVKDWDNRRVDYSDQLGTEWSISVVLVAIVVMAFSRGAPLVGTPEGWKVISEWVQSTNQQTSETAERLFAGVNTPPPQPARGEPVVYTAAPNLSEVGAPLPQGNRTVMWVITSDPPPMLEEYGSNIPAPLVKGHYWRNAIFSTYTGRGWQPAAFSAEPAASQVPGEQPPAGRYYLRQKFEIVAQHSEALFSVNDPLQVEEGIRLRRSLDGSLLLEGNRSEYAVISVATRAGGFQLAAAGQEYPPAIRVEYLQLPDSLPARVRSLAARVAGSGAPFDQAMRIQEYLRANYPYDLKTPPPPEGRDVVDNFLFDVQQGFCSHYASAMVVMLRAQGIPSRVAAGYATGNFDTERYAYRVTQEAVHAWVEVYFPGIGWVEFEPTAARAPFVYPQTDLAAGALQPAPALQPKGEGGLPQPVVLAMTLLVVLALLAAPLTLLRLFALRRALPSVQVDSLYRQMRRALAWAGITAAASVTPEEFLLRSSGQIAPYAGLVNALRQATSLYQQAIYSDHPPEASRVLSTFSLWRQSFHEWLKLWLRSRFKRS